MNINKTLDPILKSLCLSYVEKIDVLKISNIFASYSDYTTAMLRHVYEDENNAKYIDRAKEAILELSRRHYQMEDATVYMYTRELEDYFYSSNEMGRALGETKTKLYYLCYVGFIICFYNNIKDYTREKIHIVDDLLNKDDAYCYRGQTNYNWRLSPSILRGFEDSVVLDDNYYYSLLKKDKTEDKFNMFIRTKDTNTYDKYAFMQHSRSFSPLIDFTKHKANAISFALSNSLSVNDFRNYDSVIFRLNLTNSSQFVISNKDDAKKFLKKDFKIYIINSDHFIFGHVYNLRKSDGSIHTICYTSFDELIYSLRPKYKILDIPTNDRMKYQKGLFLCFYDCLTLNSLICYELTDHIKIIKEKIPKEDKRRILDKIYQEDREHDITHLMEPYLLFKE